MKIEKINDNQIRCTVTLADLQDRHLKISELITNSAKAKLLLQDMVQQAAAEFGFDVEGMSLMIETAPASKDAVVFTITRLAGDGSPDDEPLGLEAPLNKLFGAESVAHFIQKLRSSIYGEESETAAPEAPACVFSFDNLEQVIQTAIVFDGLFNVNTSLYRDDLAACYLLIVCRRGSNDLEFNRACNKISEYAALEDSDNSVLAYIKEHNRLIIAGNALEVLATMNPKKNRKEK